MKFFLLNLNIFFLVFAFRGYGQTTYYSRVASGNWNTASSWSTTSCGGTAASSFPNSSNAIVHICNGHTITFNQDATIQDLYIDNGGTLTYSTFSGLVFNVNGSINIAGTGIFDANASPNGIINLKGNWNNTSSSPFVYGKTLLVFLGTTAQSINSGITEDFYSVTINNTSAAGVTLNTPVTITKTLTFTSGKIFSSSAKKLILNSSSNHTGSSASSHVSGPVKRFGTSSFDFPIGKNGIFRPLNISTSGLPTDAFTAEYFAQDPNPLYSVSAKASTVGVVSRCEYWYLNHDAGTAGTKVILTYGTESCNTAQKDDYEVVRWDGTQWQDYARGSGTNTSSATTGTVATPGSPVLTSFGPFTLMAPCISSSMVSIANQPTAKTICVGANTSFVVNVTGPNPTYRWQVNTGTGYTNITNNALYAGATTATLNIIGATFSMNGYNYRCVVSNICTSSINSNAALLTVNNNPVITNTVKTDVTCIPGSITVTASGTAPLQYSKNNGTSFQSSNVFTGLAVGTYQMVVRTASNCVSPPQSVSIIQATTLSLSETHTNVSCNGGNNGSITVTPNGGTGTLQYSKDNGINFQTSNVFSNLAAGTYQILVKDINNCTATSPSVTITQPLALTITPTVINVNCAGGNNGSITLAISGGTGLYTYDWGGGITSASRTTLIAGSYSVTIKDANNCSASATVIVTQPTALTVSINKVGRNLSAVALGGTPVYQYAWSPVTVNNDPTSKDQVDLPDNTYTVVVTDAHGCSINAVASVVGLYWIGSSTNIDWDVPANWSTGTVPTATDVAVFDNRTIYSCNVNIDAIAYGIEINTNTYIITQLNNNKITVGGEGIKMSGGNVAGGAGEITLAGPLALSGGSFASTSGVLKVGEDFNVSGTASFIHNNGTVELTGTSAVTNNNDFYNLKVNGVIQLASDIHVDGNLTIDAGKSLSSLSNNIFLTGDWNNNGSFIEGTGSVTFNGNSNQQINNNGSAEVFYDLKIDQASLHDVILNTDISISHLLTFSNGVIQSTATNSIEFKDNATVSGASDLSFVSGPVIKTGDDPFVFPVGEGTGYRPITISAPTGTSLPTDIFTAQYFNTEASNTSAPKPVTIRKVCEGEYWNLIRTGNQQVQVGLDYENSLCENFDPQFLRVINFNGTSWVDNGGTLDVVNKLVTSTNALINYSGPVTFGEAAHLIVNTVNVHSAPYVINAPGISPISNTSGLPSSHDGFIPTIPSTGTIKNFTINISQNADLTNKALDLQVSYTDLLEIGTVKALFSGNYLPMVTDYYEIVDGYKLYFYNAKPVAAKFAITTNLEGGVKLPVSKQFQITIPANTVFTSSSLQIFKMNVQPQQQVYGPAATLSWDGTSASAGVYEFQLEMVAGATTKVYKGQFIVD